MRLPDDAGQEFCLWLDWLGVSQLRAMARCQPIGQQLHLPVIHIGDGHPGLLVSRRCPAIPYRISAACARPPPDDWLREAISFVTR